MKKPKSRKYIIYRIDADAKGYSAKYPKKVVLKKFKAENDEEALKVLSKYKKTASKEFTYYYSEEHVVQVVDESGKTTKQYADVHQMIDDIIKEKSIFSKMKTWLSCKWSRLEDAWYWTKRLWHYIKTGHDPKAAWSLDSYILKEIAWNLKVLEKNAHGCSPVFLDKAREIVHKDDKSFNAEEYAKKLNYDYDEAEWKLAVKLRSDEYHKMAEHIALYDYYANFGIADKELVDDAAEFEKKWKHTLPIKPGTYRDFDYKKLHNLSQKQWNKIWEWMRKYGQELWD